MSPTLITLDIMTEPTDIPLDEFKAKLEEKITVEEFQKIVDDAFPVNKNAGVRKMPNIYDPFNNSWSRKD